MRECFSPLSTWIGSKVIRERKGTEKESLGPSQLFPSVTGSSAECWVSRRHPFPGTLVDKETYIAAQVLGQYVSMQGLSWEPLSRTVIFNSVQCWLMPWMLPGQRKTACPARGREKPPDTPYAYGSQIGTNEHKAHPHPLWNHTRAWEKWLLLGSIQRRRRFQSPWTHILAFFISSTTNTPTDKRTGVYRKGHVSQFCI